MYDGDGTCVLVFMTKSKNHQLFVKEIYKDYFWVGFQENYVVFVNLKKGQQSNYIIYIVLSYFRTNNIIRLLYFDEMTFV